MADFQIGDNLYSEDTGKYYNLVNGAKSYVKSPYETAQDKINQMYEAQRKSQLDTLKAQRDKAVQGFNQQKQTLAPQYQSQRDQADVTNAQNVARLRELMAANGINMSGENITAQANMNSARQNAFNDINTQENQAMGAIDQQIAQANDPAQEQQINNAIESDRSKALADAFNQSQQQAYQQQVDWRNYQMQLQQAAQQKAQFELEQKMRELELQKAQQALAAQQAAAVASRASSSSSKKTTSKSTTSNQTALEQAYNAYKQQQAVQQKYAPTPFRATNTKPKQII